MQQRVQYFIAGVQKAGTTTLHAYLADHPELQAGETKELHFFDDETIDWTRPDYAAFEARFPAGEGRRRCFDATPIYFFWPPALQRLQAYAPEARLVVLFRDPIERAWSHWRMETTRNAEALSFSQAIREGRTRLPADTPLAPIWRVASYVERGFYAEQLERALTFFPREQLLLMKSSDLSAAPQQALGRICDFFGIGRFSTVDARFDHVGSTEFGEIAPDDVAYLKTLFREDTRRFAHLSGLDLSDWLTLAD